MLIRKASYYRLTELNGAPIMADNEVRIIYLSTNSRFIGVEHATYVDDITDPMNSVEVTVPRLWFEDGDENEPGNGYQMADKWTILKAKTTEVLGDVEPGVLKPVIVEHGIGPEDAVYWLLGPNRVICGNSTLFGEVTDTLPSELE